MEKKGLRVNAGKTKVMLCSIGLDLLQSSRASVAMAANFGCIRNAAGYYD